MLAPPTDKLPVPSLVKLVEPEIAPVKLSVEAVGLAVLMVIAPLMAMEPLMVLVVLAVLSDKVDPAFNVVAF